MAANPFSIKIDPRTGFSVIGQGSLGGKARGLAVVCDLLGGESGLASRYPQMEIAVPETLVIAGSGFEAFIEENGLGHLAHGEAGDEQVAEQFLKARLPRGLEAALARYLDKTHYPLAVRSSGLLEDLRYHAYAGLYRTYMLSNDQPDPAQRLERLVEAVKLVYASTYFQGPRAYAKRVGHRVESGTMAVMIQKVAGSRQNQFYYPAISGVAQSLNYYPLGRMKAEEGLVTIALGLGKQVVSGERALRFCPKYPRRLLQRGTVEEVLDYAQRRFYALEMGSRVSLHAMGRDHVVRRMVGDAVEEPAVRLLTSTYVPAEHRIRDSSQVAGHRVLTFANVLKYDLFPFAAIIRDLLASGEKVWGAVEIELAVTPAWDQTRRHRFYVLQMRPMTARQAGLAVDISGEEQSRAICYSQNTMGNGQREDIQDIVYIKPETFDPSRTRPMVRRVAEINVDLEQRRRPYLLVGPGRWGSADPWLGIPVRWADISQVAAIVETTVETLKTELSQGAHFFHNMTSLGISYFCVSRRQPDAFNWPWLTSRTVARQNEYVAHVRLDHPLILKVDGRSSRGVILVENKGRDADNEQGRPPIKTER